MIAQRFLLAMAVLLLGWGAIRIVLLRRRLTNTTLGTAWAWGLAAEFAWLLSALYSLQSDPVQHAFLDQIWYWTAVLTLCPPIAVLGARRPTSRVWNWFILVPLIAVLGWPAVTVLTTLPDLAPLRVQIPVFVGFVLVLIMGFGNYAGTRYSLPCVLLALATGCLLRPVSALAEMPFETAQQIRGGSAVLFAVGLHLAFRQGDRPTVANSPFDRLWFDFRDTFGIVWSIRLQERINSTAQQERWPVQLGPHGFEWKDHLSPADQQQTVSRIDYTFRWLLRRFVDPEWIDRRLGQ